MGPWYCGIENINEADLSELHVHLLEMVNETISPACVSLWQRSPGEQRNLEADKNQPGERGITP